MSDKILKLSQAQTLYEDLRGRIDALPTDSDIPDVPVQDVQVNGVSVLNQGVANVPVASDSAVGVVKVESQSTSGLTIDSTTKGIRVSAASSNYIKAGSSSRMPIVPDSQHVSTFYGLAKAAGADMKDIANTTVGTYPDAQKAAIQNMLGITDLISTEESSTATAAHAINSTFLMNGKLHRATAAIAIGDAVEVGTNCEVVKADEVFVKNTDIATTNDYGIVKIGRCLQLNSTTQALEIRTAGSSTVKQGTSSESILTPEHINEAAFYGLAKAAGADEKNSTEPLGTYTDAAKVAIRNMLGATSSNVIAVQDEQPTDSDTKVWLPETEPTGIEVPTYAEFQALDAAVVKKTDIASSSTAGIVSVSSTYGVQMITNSNNLAIQMASTAEIKAGSNYYKPIVPNSEHTAVYYGLSKAAGVDLASETVTVGTYPATASAAIRAMLGTVGDVQINSSSVVNNGVATIPLATLNGSYGVIKLVSGNGIGISDGGNLIIMGASSEAIKNGTNGYTPLAPIRQHEAAFYGLAKAAGDSTQSASSNAVGTYTNEAKVAIHTMLGIDPASIAAQVDIPLVETVSGTTPTITGQPNVRYVCGEISTITITPPASGSVDVIFESGSTATTMTVPSTVKWPAWFDAETLEANTTYEVLITDSVYGSVMTWAT